MYYRSKNSSKKHKILTEWFHKTFVPLESVQVVYEDEKDIRLLVPGYHARPRWNQRYGKLISTAVCRAKLKDVTVCTIDRIRVKISGIIAYRFLPQYATVERLPELIELSEPEIERRAVGVTSGIVREICSQYPEEFLTTGENIGFLSRNIINPLQALSKSSGIPIESFFITDVRPPPNIEEARQEAICRGIYGDSLSNAPGDFASELHEKEIARQALIRWNKVTSSRNKQSVNDAPPQHHRQNGVRPQFNSNGYYYQTRQEGGN